MTDDKSNLTYEQYNEKGDEFFDDDNPVEALSCFEKAIELEPNNAIAIKNAAYVLFEMDKNEEGLKFLNKAIELEPNNAEYWAEKCYALDRIGNKDEEANTCISKALKLDPDGEHEIKRKLYGTLKGVEQIHDTFDKAVKQRIDNLTTLADKADTLTSELEKFRDVLTADLDDDEERLRDICESSEQMYDYYEVLGISMNASSNEIRDRFRELSIKFHPDKEPSALSNESMKKIIQAYDTLKDPEKRNAYDQTL